MAIKVALLTSKKQRGLATYLRAWINAYGDYCWFPEDVEAMYRREKGHRADVIVSYNYDKKVPYWALNYTLGVNLHVGYLSWNKGAHPVLWSALQCTPMGVTLHWMTETIDVGEIIARRIVEYGERESLREIYTRSQSVVQGLFKSWWPELRNKIGNRHYKDELDSVVLPRGWDTTADELRAVNASAKARDEAMTQMAHRAAYGEVLE